MRTRPFSRPRTLALLVFALFGLVVVGCDGGHGNVLTKSALPQAEDYSWLTMFAERALEAADHVDDEAYLTANPNLPRWPGVPVVAWLPPELAHLRAALARVTGYRPGDDMPPSYWERQRPVGQGGRADTWALSLHEVLIDGATRRSARIMVSFGPRFGYAYEVDGYWDGAEWVVENVALQGVS